MTALVTQADSEEGELQGYVYDEEASVRIVGNEEGGADRVGLDAWFNSARISVDPDREEVTCVVSIGDPRGGFVFQVRRNSKGQILIHTPYPGESMPHMRTKQDHEGTLIVVGDHGDEPLTFDDEEQLNRDYGWRDGWEEMEDGFAQPEDRDAVYGIEYHEGRDSYWQVVELSTRKVPKGADDVTHIDDAEEAAERAEELNEEALEEDEE